MSKIVKGTFMNTKKYFTTGEVSQMTDISQSTVSLKFDAGILSGKKNPITGDRFISRESLISFMKKFNIRLKDIGINSQKHIILGSADENLRSIVNQAFSKDERIEIVTVPSGCDILMLCTKNPPELLIIDDELSDISSAEAVRSLKRHDEQRKIKILYCIKTNSLEKLKEIDANDFFIKDSLIKIELVSKVALLLDIEKTIKPDNKKYIHERQQPRIPVNLSAHLELYCVNTPRIRKYGNSRVEDISIGGATLSQIRLGNGNIPSEAFRILLKIDHCLLNDWQAECSVTRLQIDKSITAGVEFVNISQQNKDKISAFVSKSNKNI